ncbi:hypothetical protein F4561_005843 [Lipingzhangella halophila]|uniref:Uncharacterized protein n=1 Tax=Lipingzhangella halophila TaxID=1783352 RepID=A0A7W7W6I7_9ACTN|nr:hypothetical protein [Lipingzhangella halophila]MBB4934949.1 hypothetical protein [Lipingzhangella halophila]
MTGLVSSLVTLVIAIAITGTVVYVRGDFRAGASPSPAGVPEEPCASIDEERLDEISAQESSFSVQQESSSCSWDAQFDGMADVTLQVTYATPMSSANASRAEERGVEPTTGAGDLTDAGDIYEGALDNNSEPVTSTDEVLGKREEPQDFGDESALVYLRTEESLVTYSTSRASKAALVIRDGDRVTEIRVRKYGDTFSFSPAQSALTDLADDVPWQEG